MRPEEQALRNIGMPHRIDVPPTLTTEIADTLGLTPADTQALADHLAQRTPHPNGAPEFDVGQPVAPFARALATNYSDDGLSRLASLRGLHRQRDEADADLRTRLIADAGARVLTGDQLTTFATLRGLTRGPDESDPELRTRLLADAVARLAA
ncbi:MAG: hypothetical protein ACRBN8_46370 [Nannocystales bacterium]